MVLGQRHQRVICRTPVAKRTEFAASYIISSQLDGTAGLLLWEGQEPQTQFSLRHCGLGDAGTPIQYLAEEGQEHYRQCCGSGPW